MFIKCAQQVWKLHLIIKTASSCFQKLNTFLAPKPDSGSNANPTKEGELHPPETCQHQQRKWALYHAQKLKLHQSKQIPGYFCKPACSFANTLS